MSTTVSLRDEPARRLGAPKYEVFAMAAATAGRSADMR
jgi:hypothetical protein